MKQASKFIALFLAIMMIFSSYSIVSFAGVTTPSFPVCTTHQGGEANCQTRATCSVCGTLYGELGGHVFSSSSDTSCNLCDYTRSVSDSPIICLNHVYSSDCDVNCNKCGTLRETDVEHEFENSSDDSCDNCGFIRSLPQDPESPSICFEHLFDDCFDATCNKCGSIREIIGHVGGNATCTEYAVCTVCGVIYGELLDHIYDNDDDVNCNGCGFVRTPPTEPESPSVCFRHTYDGCQDVECNVCGFLRKPGEHKGGFATCKELAVCDICGLSYGEFSEHNYENSCDADCNECGEIRTPGSHEYTDSGDSTCNICGFIREVIPALPGDANLNGVVDKEDFDLIQRYINDWKVKIDPIASDYNKDGKIDNKDLGLMQKDFPEIAPELIPDKEEDGDNGGSTKPGTGVVGDTDLWN